LGGPSHTSQLKGTRYYSRDGLKKKNQLAQNNALGKKLPIRRDKMGTEKDKSRRKPLGGHSRWGAYQRGRATPRRELGLRTRGSSRKTWRGGKSRNFKKKWNWESWCFTEFNSEGDTGGEFSKGMRARGRVVPSVVGEAVSD